MSESSLPAKILIVDDHIAARITVREILDWHGFQVLGEAKDAKQAIEKVIELKPDIVVLDINMPGMNGVQAAHDIRRISPQTKIVFLTIHDSPAVSHALRVWAHGFVSKSAAGTELLHTLNRLAGIPPDGSLKPAEPPHPLAWQCQEHPHKARRVLTISRSLRYTPTKSGAPTPL